MAGPDIAIVVSPRSWAERLHRFTADHGGARVRARVLEAREAIDHDYAVLVVEDLTSFLTPRVVEELHVRGRRILGVFEPAEPWGRQGLEELGVDETAPADTPPEELLRIIESLAAGIELDREIIALVEEPESGPPPGSAPGSEPRGAVTVIAGPPGGPGATEVAIGVAAELSRQGEGVVLVDADEIAPALAQRLGLALHPNLRTAIDAVEHRAGDLPGSLQRLGRSALDVLTGLADASDRHDIRASELIAVLDELAARYTSVVVNVGHLLEAGRPDNRRGLTAATLGRADQIIGIGAPTPVGIARLLAWTADVRSVAPLAPLHLAVNRTPAGRFKRGELAHEIRRTVHVRSLVFLPEDTRVERAAWDGRVVESGPFTRAVADLCRQVDAATSTEAAVSG